MIRLHYSRFSLAINPFGAELLALCDINGKNLLWEKQTDHWNRVSPHLFPIVGKLKNDQYELSGKLFHMSQHGFARDREFRLIEQTEREVLLELCSDAETRSLYPYHFSFRVRFTCLDNGVRISYETTNNDSETLLYSVGGHPAFHLEESLENYYLEFDKETSLLRRELKAGHFTGVSQDYGRSRQLSLSGSLFEADAFVLKNPEFREIQLKHRSGNTLITMVCENWTDIGFWTKDGAPFICIEPWWGCADPHTASGKLAEKERIRRLAPDETECLSYTLFI